VKKFDIGDNLMFVLFIAAMVAVPIATAVCAK
jgi:hypothetical protein